MAATKLIAMHQNKGRSVIQCLKDRTDYAMNGEKTEDGKYISSYQCNPELVDLEFAEEKRNICIKLGGSQKEMSLHIRSASLSNRERSHRKKQIKSGMKLE